MGQAAWYVQLARPDRPFFACFSPRSNAAYMVNNVHASGSFKAPLGCTTGMWITGHMVATFCSDGTLLLPSWSRGPGILWVLVAARTPAQPLRREAHEADIGHCIAQKD